MNARTLRRFFWILVLLLIGGGGQAAVLEVAPVTIELSGGAEAAAITLKSHDPSPVYVQVRGFVWSQSGNTDKLTPTDDIALAPPIFSLPGDTPQIVRIVLQQAVGDRELAYRLLIDQIPAHESRTGVQFALRLSLPVFVEPEGAVAANIKAHIALGTAGPPVLAIDNIGTRRTRLIDIALSTTAGLPLKLSAPPNPYILPGVERSWTILSPVSAIPPGSMLRLTAKTDNGPLVAHVAFGS
jgi:fimbrial chaperone protein